MTPAATENAHTHALMRAIYEEVNKPYEEDVKLRRKYVELRTELNKRTALI